MKDKGAFSLVELSIVLVILGLLTGGILAGQSLIRAAEVRSLGAQYQRFAASVYSFRDKYQAIPGDMTNATSFWGKDNVKCPSHTGTAATPGTCNGNGDGTSSYSGTTSATAEIYQAWKQMALAGLIEGDYTGYSGAIVHTDHDIGVNAPASRVSNVGWCFSGTNASGGANNWYFARDYSSFFSVGLDDITGTSLDNAFLKTEEAWNVDSKFDDGKPGQGKLQAQGGITICTTATTTADYNATYRLDDSGANKCALLFSRD